MVSKKPKSRLVSILGLDPIGRAESLVAEGQLEKGARLFERAKDFRRATRYYAEGRNKDKAIETAIKAVLGPKAVRDADATLQYAAELLISVGGRKEAVPLYELAGDYVKAAQSAAKAGQRLRAAQLYDRIKEWKKAAAYYEKAGSLREALRSYDREAHRLQALQSHDAKARQELRQIQRYRGELMAKLGHSAPDANGPLSAASTSGKWLEQSGRYREAVDAFVASRDFEEAFRLVREQPSLDDRLQADILKQTGKLAQAAQIYGALGFNQEAALAWQEAGDWQQAARNWKKSHEPAKAGEAYLKAESFGLAAGCFEAAGATEKALEAYQASGDFTKVAECQMRLERPIEAAASFMKARKNLEAARLLIDQGMKAEAVDVLRQVPASAAGFEQANLLAVEILFESGELEEALHRVLLLTADIESAGEAGLARLYWEGRIREGMKRDQEARGCYEKLVGLRSGYRDASHRLNDLQQRMTTAFAETAPAVHSVPPQETLGPTAPAVGPAKTPVVGNGKTGVGEILADRYELLAELGRGGMGLVYKAHDRVLDEPVAIKTLLQQMGLQSVEEARLLREVRICRKLTHPNIVRVHDIRRFHGGVFITMELLEGKGLDHILARRKPVKLQQAKGVLGQVAAGLAEAHSLKIVHRDLKPANLFLAGSRIKILDFGIARMPDATSQLTQTGHVIGSPHYMSPEQLQGQPIDGRADIYSLGIIAFRLLAGNEPFTGETMMEVLLAHLQQTLPEIRELRQGVPEAWSRFLTKMLAKSAADRFQSIAEVQAELAQLPVEAA
ncbi:MAG: protein kinase [Acidobacteriota bacterium]